MDARFERYIENLRTVRTLSQPKFSPDMKAKELLETIQSNAIKCFDYMKENNAILNELVFQRAPAELTSAEIASLQEFADKMFNYASSEDCGIAYKVYSLLLENARIRGDKPAIVRYLYGKAVSLHYLNVRGRDYAINPYGTQVRGLFQEGAGYIAEYESFDKITKGYIMRCLGNSRMSMPRSTPEECTEYMKVFDKAMGIITDPYYHQLDPDLPWGKFEYAMHMDRETLLSYLRHHNDPVVAAKVMESAEAIYRDRVLYKGEEARLQNWRVIRRPASMLDGVRPARWWKSCWTSSTTPTSRTTAILASTRTSRRCLIWWLTRSRCRLPTGGRWHAAPKK